MLQLRQLHLRQTKSIAMIPKMYYSYRLNFLKIITRLITNDFTRPTCSYFNLHR